MLGTILIVLLILALVGGLPNVGLYQGSAYSGGGLGLVLVIVVVLLLMGRI